MSASSQVQLVGAGEHAQAALSMLTIWHAAASSPMLVVVQEQVQKQHEETLQRVAQLIAQRQGQTSPEALQAKSEALQAKEKAKESLGKLTDGCQLQSWVL